MKSHSKSSSPRAALTRSTFRSLVTVGAGLLSLAGSVQAADNDYWIFSGDVNNPTSTSAITGGGTGNFDDGPAGYWSPIVGGVAQTPVKPTANNYNAVINNGGTVNITTDQTPVDIIVGSIANGNGTFNQTAGNVTQTLGWFRLGTFAGAAGTGGTGAYNMSGGTLNLTAAGANQQYNVADSAFSTCFNTIGGGPGTAAVTGNLSVLNVGGGASSNGTMSVNTGGSFTANTTVAAVAYVGNGANSTGTLNIAGGTMSLSTTGVGTFVVANALGSNGTFNLSSGTFTFAPSAAGANNGTNTAIGSTGTANFNITGGTANFQPTAGGYPLAVGRASNSTGTITMSGGTLNNGTATVPQEMWIGNAPGVNPQTPNGTFNMSGGTTNVSSWLAVARGTNGAGTGVLNVSGGTLNAAINAGNISLSGTNAGNVGTTTVTGGSLNTPNAIYVTEGNLGTLNISGTGAVNEFSGTGLRLNLTATTNTTSVGTVNLGDGVTAGGLLSVNNVNTVNTGAARSIFNFNGGTLQAKANSGTFFNSGGTNNVRNLGARIDSNQTVITISQPLTHSNIAGDNVTDGGLTKLGLGSLILSGANTYTGNTTITAGALDAQNGAASVPGLNTAGRVNVGAAGALVVGVGYAAGSSVGDIDTARASNTFAPGGSIGLDIAAPAGPATYGTNLTPAVTTDFYKLGAGQLFLVGANTYTGITYLQGGLLSPNIGSLGSGGFTFNGGGLQFAAGDTTNFSNRAVVFNGNATIDTNGNNVNFTNPVTGVGGGQLIKQGLGTLTFSGGFNFSPTRAFVPGVAGFGNVFVQGGTLTLTGATTTVNTGGAFSSIGQAAGNLGTLNLLNGATFATTTDFNVADVGGASAAALAGGIVNLSGTGTSFTGAGFFVGKGTSTAANFAYGVFNQSGGTVTQNNNAQIGAFGVGQYNLTGGTWNHTGGYLSVARQPLSFGVVDVNGATAVYTDTAAGTRSIIGEQGTGTLNVRNGGVFNANNSTTNNSAAGTLTSALAALTIANTAGTAAAPTTGVVNLLPGGTINTQSIGSIGGAVANTTSLMNFSGGILKNTVATPTLIQNLTAANVYGNVGGTVVNGAIVDTTAGSATIAQPLVAPAGQGVSAIAATGSGFASTPIVQITGGGGVGATAVATVDVNGNLNGVTITNPGINYTSAPTVTVTGPLGTTTTGTATIANNVSGGLTKQGINTLTLTGVNTYTGNTTISAGTLALTGTGSIATSPLITTAAGATFSLSTATTFPTTQTLTGTGTIQATANALTINGIVSPGATPAAADIGTLTIATTGTLTLSGTAVLQFDILSAANKDLINAPGAALTVSGTLAVRGTVTAGTTYTLVSGLASETGNFATVTGVPANLTPQYSFTAGNYNVTFIPEPSTWAMGVAGLGLAALWLRRRRVA